MIALVGAIMLYALATRETLDLSALHDRNPLYVTLANGDVRNAYTIKLLNKQHEERHYQLTVEGLKGASLDIVGVSHGTATLAVPADSLRSFRVLVTAPRDSATGRSLPITFVATDMTDGATAREESTFQEPPR